MLALLPPPNASIAVQRLGVQLYHNGDVMDTSLCDPSRKDEGSLLTLMGVGMKARKRRSSADLRPRTKAAGEDV